MEHQNFSLLVDILRFLTHENVRNTGVRECMQLLISSYENELNERQLRTLRGEFLALQHADDEVGTHL